MIAWFFAGVSPSALFLILFNRAITGNAFLLPVMSLEGYNQCWSFSRALGSWKEYLRLHITNFIKWTPPFLLLIYLFSLPSLLRKWRSSPAELIFCCLVIGHLFYAGTGGNQYGPRYYYEAFPFLVLGVTGALFGERRYIDKSLLNRALVLFLAFSLVWNIPMSIRHFIEERLVIFERGEPYRLVESGKIRNAIVFLKTGSGRRRPMPSRDLTRNEADFSNDVLYALDGGAENIELMRRYPGKGYYVYRYDGGKRRGFLEKH